MADDGKNEAIARPDDHYVDAAAFFIARDDAGQLLPVDWQLPGFGLIAVLPMTQSEIKRFRKQVGDSDWVPAWLQAEVIKRHVHRPVFEISKDDVEQAMLGFVPARLIEAVFRASGFRGSIESDEGGQVAVRFDDDEGNF